MQMKQATNPFMIAVSILVCAYAGNMLLIHPHQWEGFLEASKDASLTAVLALLAWIFAKSPFAGIVAQVATQSAVAKHEEIILPDGAVKKTDTIVTGKTVTTTSEPEAPKNP